VIKSTAGDETLDDLSAHDVFTRCLDTFEVAAEDRDELYSSYNEIIRDLMEEDRHAE
jgi:exonuclease SbcD